MSESIFKFKKFEIIQNKSVMKVGTDGVLLGAIIRCNNINKILDIGTGTGLIALMLAQKCDALIDCIDLNSDAVKLASLNIKKTKWFSRMRVFNISIQNFLPQYKYDLIVTNPPYFTTDIIAPDSNRALARHCIELSFLDLAHNVFRLLDDNGSFFVIYPTKQAIEFESIANSIELYTKSKYNIFSKRNQEPVRIIAEYKKTVPDNIWKFDVVIENQERHDYTAQYKDLTKDYYLKF